MDAASTEIIVCPQCGALNRAPAAKLTAGESPKCGKCHQPLFKGEPVAVLQATNFDRIIAQGTLPVIVDFWAQWCGPCRMMAPHFAAAARDMEPRVRFLKIDTEAAPDIAGRYGIRSIPTLILFHNGREIARQSGAMDTRTIERWIKAAVGGGAAG